MCIKFRTYVNEIQSNRILVLGAPHCFLVFVTPNHSKHSLQPRKTGSYPAVSHYEQEKDVALIALPRSFVWQILPSILGPIPNFHVFSDQAIYDYEVARGVYWELKDVAYFQ